MDWYSSTKESLYDAQNLTIQLLGWATSSATLNPNVKVLIGCFHERLENIYGHKIPTLDVITMNKYVELISNLERAFTSKTISYMTLHVLCEKTKYEFLSKKIEDHNKNQLSGKAVGLLQLYDPLRWASLHQLPVQQKLLSMSFFLRLTHVQSTYIQTYHNLGPRKMRTDISIASSLARKNRVLKTNNATTPSQMLSTLLKAEGIGENICIPPRGFEVPGIRLDLVDTERIVISLRILKAEIAAELAIGSDVVDQIFISSLGTEEEIHRSVHHDNVLQTVFIGDKENCDKLDTLVTKILMIVEAAMFLLD